MGAATAMDAPFAFPSLPCCRYNGTRVAAGGAKSTYQISSSHTLTWRRILSTDKLQRQFEKPEQSKQKNTPLLMLRNLHIQFYDTLQMKAAE